ncbi:SDR family NAD(P)-dependent oxidoreductase [Compostimonas suwonensis]|uniref:3-oxoacyl-[acyl-carrier protein] reductase n=1 Tax=Compostimonas suwonensis TaxID=1048394 RepID=A0A2M9C0K4_9MICO|nr:SDR family oxidoreductase [Compostimonas suwonensis]PJJ63845.1 3-oxoacyl-[acyl-carrier protein] reductase [Compostimonas suwonensis]
MTDMTGKVVLITGGTRGIGRSVGLAFAREGATIVASYTADEAAAAQLGTELDALGVKHLTVRSDSARPEEIRSLFAQAKETFGRIDVVVSNAGVELIDTPILETTDAQLDLLLNVNIRGTFYTLQEAAKAVEDGGRIIATGSTIALNAPAGASLYSATKGALKPMVQAVAREVATRGITANLITPGVVEGAGVIRDLPQETIDQYAAFNPFGRQARPDDIGPVAVFLASPGAAFINGQAIAVDGGSFM